MPARNEIATFGYGLHVFCEAHDRAWSCAAFGTAGAGMLGMLFVITQIG